MTPLRILIADDQALVRAGFRMILEVEDALYRLTQEALTNALKHAGAARAEVTLRERDGAVELLVRDDGEGFATEQPAGGFGLVGMRERAELLGGRLEITSAPGQGTTVRAVLPAERLPASDAGPAARTA